MSPLNSIVVGIGVLILIEAVVGMLYGAANRDFPPAFSTETYAIGGTALLSNQDIFTISSVLILMLALAALFTWTPIGSADARGRLRPRGRPVARGQGGPDAHPRLGTGRTGRGAGRDAW